MLIKVYSKPHCAQCDATKKILTEYGINFSVIDVTDNPEAVEELSSLGYKQVPVVVAGDNHWSGFRIEKLAGLRNILQENQ